MKVTYNWLKEFVELKVSPEKLSHQLTMAGLSVASLERFNNDWVYDIEVTSNRPDWLSVRGIACEVAAVTGGKIKKKDDGRGTIDNRKKRKNRKAKEQKLFSITIEDREGCSLYWGSLIKDVKVASSPEWLKIRLESVGLRPVNNVVDITNYCLMEFGQPLHAFDFDKIRGSSIIVRHSRPGERLALIDGSEKKLDPEVLVIADSLKPLAAAGIMGGKDSEVTERTVNVLLESACFDPVTIRKGTRSLGLASDASYRFERGVDKAGVKKALDAAARMINDLCGGIFIESLECGAVLKSQNLKIAFPLKKVEDILSVHIPSGVIRDMLENLGFGVKAKTKDIFQVTVPTFRRDIKDTEDLIEEVARIYGYEKIPLTTPSIKPFSFKISACQALLPKVRDVFVASGLKEVITYSLLSEDDFKKSAIPQSDDVKCLENSLSQDYSILRSTLVPSLLKTAVYNVNRNNKNFEIFELSHIFAQKEELAAGLVLCGARRSTWLKEFKNYTFFDLKGILETLLVEVAVKNYKVEAAQEEAPWAHTAAVLKVDEETLCVFGQVSESVKAAWEMKSKEDIFIAEIFLEKLAKFAHLDKTLKPFLVTPSILRDVSVLAPAGVSFEKIKSIIQKQAEGYLKNLSFVECYQGKEIPGGCAGLTFSLEYAVLDRTLTDEEVNGIHQKVLQSLTADLGLKLR